MSRPPFPPRQRIDLFRRRLLSWAAEFGRSFPWRSRNATVYERVISEVLLQRTRAETVAAFFPKFLASFPSWSELNQASERKLQAQLKPIGLWRRRATSIKRLACAMTALNGAFPTCPADLSTLPSVGQYVGNAVMLFAHRRPAPLLDSGMARVLERFFGPRKLADIRDDPYLQALSHAVVAKSPITTNWALLDFAALVCAPKPKCGDCPLSSHCQFVRGRGQSARS